MRSTRLARTLAALCVALCAALCAPPGVPAADPKPEPKKTVVAVEEARYASLDKAVTDQKGKVVLVDFWATWCPPCVKKFPTVVALHTTYKDKGLAVVSVSLDKGKRGYKINKVLDFLADHKATFPNYVVADAATDGKDISERFGLDGSIPHLALFDKTGKRVWDSSSKPLADKDLKALIETELAK